LKLKYDGLLSSFAFKFNLRRYIKGRAFSAQPEPFFFTKPTQTTQRIPKETLTSSRNVDDLEPILTGERCILTCQPDYAYGRGWASTRPLAASTRAAFANEATQRIT